MTPVDQTIVDVAGKGDCHRAVIASLLDLDITQVPHFGMYHGESGKRWGLKWHDVYINFMRLFGFDFCGTMHFNLVNTGKVKLTDYLSFQYSINGYFDASVKSKTFDDTTHAVVMDMQGLVVHDPNPNKKWLGINIVESGELLEYIGFRKVE